MSIIDALIQGIIQGITEFLPVSSSGHLALYQHVTGNSGDGAMFFSLMLHIGTLAAVVIAFYNDIWRLILEFGRMVKDIFNRQFSFKTDNPDRKMIFMLVLATLPLVLVVPLHGVVSGLAEDNDIVVEGVCFLITSFLLFMACRMPKSTAGIEKMRPRSALTVGLMQAAATMPGISRSGSTISTGLLLGFDRSFMVKFSFLLGIPAILGGAVVEVGDAVEQGVNVDFWPLFLGMLAAALVGYLCIRLVQWLVLSNKFIIFAVYTGILGVVVVVWGAVEHIISAVGGASGAVAFLPFLR